MRNIAILVMITAFSNLCFAADGSGGKSSAKDKIEQLMCPLSIEDAVSDQIGKGTMECAVAARDAAAAMATVHVASAELLKASPAEGSYNGKNENDDEIWQYNYEINGGRTSIMYLIVTHGDHDECQSVNVSWEQAG